MDSGKEVAEIARVVKCHVSGEKASLIAKGNEVFDADAIDEDKPGSKGSESLVINDKTFRYMKGSQEEEELLWLVEIAKRESGQKQFAKQGICLLLIVCVILMNYLNPSSHIESPIGISMCGFLYWFIQFLFVCLCGVMTWVAVRIASSEQKVKVKYGVNHLETDVILEGKALIIIILIGLIGGLVAGALGLGGGSIYNPALLALGVHPKSSGATGMFLVLFGTINTCLINFLNGFLDIEYACWISTFSLLGSIGGMIATDWVVKKTGKPSVMVWILVAVFVISTIATPIFGYISLKKQSDEGDNIMAFVSMCETHYDD